MRILLKKSGFTLIETLIAVVVFTVVIVGGNALLKGLSEGIVNMQNIIQAEMLAKNGTLIVRDIFLKESELAWGAHKSNFLGSPLEAGFILSMNTRNYDISLGNSFEGPINVYSEKDSTKITTKFYRKIHVKQLESWGLYEIESTVCFDTCGSSHKVYDVFYRK